MSPVIVWLLQFIVTLSAKTFRQVEPLIAASRPMLMLEPAVVMFLQMSEIVTVLLLSQVLVYKLVALQEKAQLSPMFK